ncbi:hypothetical protein ACPCK1_02705 [Streptomyces pseudogriseolus]|uniref:hypothetical protein n=1 Tax=Streptomyces pseudogriseolus TaxID=36817 RepID=UPI003FA22451
MTRTGYVTEAAIDVLAARLSIEIPGLSQSEIKRVSRRQAEDLVREGYRITVPVDAVPAAARRRKATRTT